MLNGIELDFKVLPFDSDDLKSLDREAFWGYTYEAGHSLERPQASLLVDAMIEEQLLQSTKDGYTDRTAFNQELDERIKLVIRKYTKVREKIGILCFTRGSEQLPQKVPILLAL